MSDVRNLHTEEMNSWRNSNENKKRTKRRKEKCVKTQKSNTFTTEAVDGPPTGERFCSENKSLSILYVFEWAADP